MRQRDEAVAPELRMHTLAVIHSLSKEKRCEVAQAGWPQGQLAFFASSPSHPQHARVLVQISDT